MTAITSHTASARAPPAGVYTPLVTFFNTDESLDLPAIRSHALRIAQGGVAGLVIHGSNGEAVHLDNAERQTVIREVRSVLSENGYPKLPLIVGCGLPSRIATVRLTKEAKEAGGDYALVLPPSYWPGAMTKPVILDFFENVANESPLPVLVYNFPMVANGVNIDSDTMIQLAQHANIVGCKLTCGNLGNLHRVASHTSPESFAVLSGKAEFALHGFVGGASGCIAALVNIAPKAHAALFRAWTSGDLKKAKEIQDLLSDADLAQSKLGVSGLKLAVSKYFGYGSGIARSPLQKGNETTLSAQEAQLSKLVEFESSL
ncbi:hypothetical protein I316_02110 [Kwoniella heveanensis BCC8398]|uniref:Dihydrodipicolinate synthase n=1 Tax=Kwoniella heveanensis BCC8398 TaxID=1296120 RepID=A0A1B9GYY5_9TREE|nr:hypothetical protein I316_02110 [Kwoniella heveanensis BCC8398]